MASAGRSAEALTSPAAAWGHDTEPQSLADTTFVVVDLETTGMSPDRCAITEIGAAKFRRGECIGTLATLVDPKAPVPPVITRLTGINDFMLTTAPEVSSVLPSLLEFLGDGILVGHNVRFDRSFLDAALLDSGRNPLPHRQIDTLALSRRMLGDEVPNHRLSTLAWYLRAARRPSHRALDDVLATADVLHALIERAGTFGIFTLDALTEFAESKLTRRRRPVPHRASARALRY